MILRLFKLYKWYQIAQRITYYVRNYISLVRFSNLTFTFQEVEPRHVNKLNVEQKYYFFVMKYNCLSLGLVHQVFTNKA